MILRRLFLLSLVLICLAFVLTGCATPGVMCNLRDRYDFETKIPDHGVALMEWDHDASKCAKGQVGCAQCLYGNCVLHLMKDDISFSDGCGLMNLGHEVGHALGKKHVPN